jgi:leucyl/phenylalanyl-tRNA--protein transferase
MPQFVTPRAQFILPRFAGDAEVVGVGEDLTPETLIWAYGHGIFPWPTTGYPLLWFCPPQRAVLDFDRLHVPERLARIRRRSEFTFTLDTAFEQVIAACRRSPRPGQEGTWITAPMLAAYQTLHRLGYTHSVEVWDASGALAGGLYGVSVGGVFSGESMFHASPNASKLALLFLCDYLQARGLHWIDIQVMTPHLAALGAREIPRDEFLDRLDIQKTRGLAVFEAEEGHLRGIHP